MYPKSAAGLLLLALSAACSPGRQPVASAPAPVPLPAEAPPAPVLETVTPVDEGLELRGAPTAVGADLLGDAQYDLPVVPNEWVRMELEFLVYQRHEVVGGWLRAADRYDEWVRDVFASYGIPRDLHHLGMIESGYRATVRSHAGAVGMWQFMPATGRGMGLRIDTLVDERMDPIRATHAAARHLRYLHRRMRGDWALAAAAYNAGEGRINRALGRYGASDFWDVAARGNLAQETKRYVPRLYAVTIIAKDPVRFGYPAPDPAGRRFAFDSMRVDIPTPLSVLAQVGNLPVNELLDLNPHLFRQIAPRNYWVWVPLGQGAPLQQAFTTSEFRQRGGFGVYRVRQGESLSRLAELSGVPVDRIRALNLSANLDNLRAGDRVRLYADAVRVLDARPAERVASARRGPRVLGDPAPGAESTSVDSSAGERRSGSSSSRRSEASASSERRSTESAASSSERSGSSTSARSSGSSERQSGASTSARGSGSSGRSGEAASSTRRSGESTASSERRSGSTASERSGASGSSTSERRSGSAATASSSRPSSSAREESGSSRPAERASSSSTSASSSRRSGSTAAAGRTHTVEDGETLWGIARRFDTTVDAVREANELDEDDTIRPGQTLRIPRASSGSSTASSATARETGSRTASGSTSGSSSSAARESGSRTASAGSSGERRSSTESSAQRRSGSTASEGRPALSTVNRMPATARAREHTVGDGETLWGIARRYETTVENLRRANDLDEDDQIQPGQKLRIPAN
ncbi:MAG TPA: LysM peptidoglycan-binding domain-containing protein [Longimicrobium sp.]|nr:LysM peptidoglycan-binding domain-containing protein [Longimicrobium sp.]